MRFPMLAFSSASPMQLAVGRAPAPAAPPAAAASAGAGAPPGPQPPEAQGEPISVYDMDSGLKRRALHFRCET